ncbi:hypothetical protein VH13_03975 [Corynebacterium ulcerans]|uniref:Uncharacterized protein n=1 Tax=Corynebacterium ramonii TaxID=3026968 RepID=A0ABM5RTR4_9CORY|nr:MULTISPECIES: hypothetical protein [Corynebacterium]AIU33003.1 Hypothetical protein CulFRC11_1434 [Corynebacterium ramonii FRC0011]AKA96977.1 Hypothetical protein CUL131002_1453c [Corynebacterium ulcerans]ESU57827.1 hypothetical protein D881_08550 [Corynebacterium ulcerans NCTC 12077]KKO85845.1 hypothetical protein VH13_03975 [Corynebacterium ulcerans]KKO87447.1 hypothetical protein VH15_04490 [Corynebacterium ulcerans]
MPTIQFDCLIDSENAASMTKRVRKLNELLIRDGKIVSADVTHDPHPHVEPLLEDQLRQILREQRDRDIAPEYDEDDVVEASEDDVTVQRFSIDVSGVGGSLNELAMTYSRLFTPPADLPRDTLALHDEQAFEQATPYPWSLEILR